KADAQTYGYVVDQFIEHYAKPRQRTWYQTERVLKNYCAEWRDRPITSISKQEARTLLRGFVAQGKPYKAAITERWLKTLWLWAYRDDLVTENMMEAVHVEVEKRTRERFYTDAEVKTIWNASNKLEDPNERA